MDILEEIIKKLNEIPLPLKNRNKEKLIKSILDKHNEK